MVPYHSYVFVSLTYYIEKVNSQSFNLERERERERSRVGDV